MKSNNLQGAASVTGEVLTHTLHHSTETEQGGQPLLIEPDYDFFVYQQHRRGHQTSPFEFSQG